MSQTSMHHSNIGSLLGSFDYVGENIGMGRGAPVSSLHVAWMHSQDHRDNMLSPGFTDRRHRRVLRARRIDVGIHRLRAAVEPGSAAAVRRQHAGQPGRPARRQQHSLLVF